MLRQPKILTLVLLALTGPAPLFPLEAASQQLYAAELDPAPINATNRSELLDSIGQLSATLQGNTLSINGTFSHLSSPATLASLRIGLAKGVPGDQVATLSVDHGQEGSVSGRVTLNANQLAALHRQALYVRIDSEKAPDGNLQGWLEPKEN